MTTLSGHRAKYWFGKKVRQAPGTELGKDARGNDGKVSQTHRWFSYDWWFGHNMTRSTAGTWSSFENRGKAPAPSKWGKPSQRHGVELAAARRRVEHELTPRAPMARTSMRAIGRPPKQLRGTW